MKKLFLIVTILLFSFTCVQSQSLKLGLSGGITNFTGPDGVTNDVSKGGLGYAAELHYGLKAKFGLPLIPLNFTGYIINHAMSTDEDGIEVSQNILSIGVGAEWALIPGPIAPYLGVDILSNTLGDLEVNGNKVNGSESSFGAAIGVGIDFKLLPKIDVDASVKYNMFNLTGRDDGEDVTSSINLNVAVLFSII